MTDSEKAAAEGEKELGEAESAGEEIADDGEKEERETSESEDTESAEDILSDFVQSFASPISSDAPCGESIRYEDDFETIKFEIDKISENDFQLVADLSKKLLTEKTKDLLVGSYLAFALTKKDGLSGFAEGVAILHVVAETFWDDVLPKKMPARGSALKFFVQKAGATLDGLKPGENERATIARALARLDKFQTFVSESMGDSAPPLSGLQRILSDIERRIPKPKAPEKPGGTEGAPAAGGEEAAPTATQTVKEAGVAVTKATTFLRKSDSANPVPYRVLRALRWSAIVQAPPNEAGKTRIPAPLEQRRTYLASLLDGADARKLLEESEASFQEGAFHFWIDLQRLTAGAMEKIGPAFENARHAVLEETALLLKRVPGLSNLTFADGTPFVGDLCADWIESEVMPLLGTGETSGSAFAGVPADDNQLFDQKTAAQKLLQKGDLPGAIKLMREGGEKDRSAKERFLRQLYLADLCMKGKRASIARPILENLDHSIEQHGLAEWEPDLALTAWSSLYACYMAMSAKAAAGDKAANVKNTGDIFEKICRIDAAYALTLPQS